MQNTSAKPTFKQIATAWASAAQDKFELDGPWIQATEIVAAYLKLPVGKVRNAPAAVCKSMELPTGSTWMEAMAFIADSGIDWTEYPDKETYLQQVRAAQAADNAKRNGKGGAA